jgi:A/G-specific adenine glycosylase
MLALPTGAWTAEPERGDGAPLAANWNDAGAVEHVFTHFALDLRLLCAEAEERSDGLWWPVERLGEAGLPTVFAKAAARAAGWSRVA